MEIDEFCKTMEMVKRECTNTAHPTLDNTLEFILWDSDSGDFIELELAPDRFEWLDNYNGVDIKQTMGCGCWYGASVVLVKK